MREETEMTFAHVMREDRSVGQIGLFGGGGGAGQSQPEPALPIVAEFDALEVLGYEHDAVGFFISGHPLARYPYDLDLLRARNSHHAAEAIFKAAAVAFRTAARQSGVAGSVPSTKGMLA